MKNEDLKTKVLELALGRIFRLASRPSQPGDVEEYERCRRIILDNGPEPGRDPGPNWVRDRCKGSAGD